MEGDSLSWPVCWVEKNFWILLPSLTALQGSAKVSAQSHNQGIKSLSHKSVKKKIPFLKGSQRSTFTELALHGLSTKLFPAAHAQQPHQATRPRARLQHFPCFPQACDPETMLCLDFISIFSGERAERGRGARQKYCVPKAHVKKCPGKSRILRTCPTFLAKHLHIPLSPSLWG